MLYRQVYTDLRDVHISHGTAHRELVGVGQGRGRSPTLRDHCIGQHGVILLRRLPLGGQLGIVGARYGRDIGGFYI